MTAHLCLEKVDWQADVHWFDFEDLCLLLDVNSGAVHIIDDATRAVLEELRTHQVRASLSEKDCLNFIPQSSRQWGRETVQEVCRELAQKQAEGSLFTVDSVGQSYRPPRPTLQALCLHVSHDCNMRCRYCFADGGPFGGAPGLMDRETGLKAIDFLFANAGSRPRVEVDFFGGEPLLNFQVVKELIDYGREKAQASGKKISYTLTTNSLALTPAVSRYLIDNELSVILSLDGRRQVHDANRRNIKGEGTYDLIVPRQQYFVKEQGHRDYWVRGTYTRQNLDFSNDALHMVELGFRYLSLEPVVAGTEAEYAIRGEDLPYLAEEYKRLAAAYLQAKADGQPFSFFHFNIDLSGGPCLLKRLSGCGAGTSYLAVTPKGELYPCHQLVGQQEYCLGNVREGILKPELQENFRQAHVYNKPACLSCWARFFCSGGCHAANLAATGRLDEPAAIACELQKMRLQAAIYIQAKEKANLCN